MILLFDIGNTHTHMGIASPTRVIRQANIPTSAWGTGRAEPKVREFLRKTPVQMVALCSVVPKVTPTARRWIRTSLRVPCFELTHTSIHGVGIDYPAPQTIGPDRLANAIAARHYFGAPAVVVDFGTAVTFDVVDRSGNYVGGIIAPGLSAMTSYLHEKTALLPAIEVREINAVIGRNTREAMLIGAVHGYRGLIRGLLGELRRELKARRLPVVATGGCARLIASKMPEITAVRPLLTLEGLRLAAQRHAPAPRD